MSVNLPASGIQVLVMSSAKESFESMVVTHHRDLRAGNMILDVGVGVLKVHA